MAPALAQFEQAYKTKLKIVEINVDNPNSPEAQQYGHYKSSQYIPETIVIKSGNIAYKKVGAMSFAELEAAVSH